MNKILAILFIALAIGVPSKDFLTYTYYNLNQSYIANVLCVNKDNPETECKGKCFLKKKIKENNSEDKIPFKLEEKTNLNWFLADAIQLKQTIVDFENNNFSEFGKVHCSLFKPRIFEPPRQI